MHITAWKPFSRTQNRRWSQERIAIADFDLDTYNGREELIAYLNDCGRDPELIEQCVFELSETGETIWAIEPQP